MDVPACAVVSPAITARRFAVGRPRLSVVVVNYVHWDDTARLVRQLRGGDVLRDGRAEVVIVDNHSPRHPVIPRLRRTPNVSLVRWRANRGFARAVNEGARLARGSRPPKRPRSAATVRRRRELRTLGRHGPPRPPAAALVRVRPRGRGRHRR